MFKKVIIFIMIIVTMCNTNECKTSGVYSNIDFSRFRKYDEQLLDTINFVYDANNLRVSDLRTYKKFVDDTEEFCKMNAGMNLKVREILYHKDCCVIVCDYTYCFLGEDILKKYITIQM